ncbi:MAG: class I SAM-dependent methyltransferase [Planctomycetes bacterium]|nr:class I SAM-dependent methyltransferase [Planctomycetota bacterium]MBL7043681.1 class I SAM-dependent methyltransferase [Pirellulaceae bacterium]
MPPRVCPWWGGYFIDNRFRRLLHKPEAILATHVRLGMAVMDFGCGMGFFAIPMARLVGNCGRVVAVDLQQKMLDALRKRAAKAGVADRIHTHRCQRDSLGVETTVDFVLAFYSVHEVPDSRRLFREIHNCLRPRGKLLVVEPIGHVTAPAFQQTVSRAEEIGFTLQDRRRIRLSRAALLKRGAAAV